MCNTLQGLNFEDIILKKNVNWQSGDDDSSARNQKEARHPAPLAPALLLDPREYLIFFKIQFSYQIGKTTAVRLVYVRETGLLLE